MNPVAGFRRRDFFRPEILPAGWLARVAGTQVREAARGAARATYGKRGPKKRGRKKTHAQGRACA
jgi:ribosome biogenesis protein Nip4